MRDLAVIARIQKIESIPNYDRVDLATVENYPVIVKKDEFDVGDLCVYVYYDTLLPVRPEFEFLRKNSYSKLYNMFRIRNMKMCGVYSSGIVFPLSILPATVSIKEGVDVSDVLGIKKYDPEEFTEHQTPVKHGKIYTYLSKYRWFRKLVYKKKTVNSYPSTVIKSDETNVEKVFNSLPKDHMYYVSEKMEGQAGTWLLMGKRRKYQLYSHNTMRDPKGDNTWAKVGRKYDLEKKLHSEKKNYAIQGEICGPNIQGNIYGFSDYVLFVYKVTEVDTGCALNFGELIRFCRKHDLTSVPIIKVCDQLKGSVEEMLTDCEGNSKCANVPREGLVWRSMTNQNIGCKAKSRAYQLWFKGNKETV